jgi:tetratricopeptide (TPR) repeat protein
MLTDAKQELALVQKYNPDDLQSHYLLALIYSSEKDYEKAAEEYEFILKQFSTVEPQNPEIHGYLAQLYYSQRKYDQAIEQFQKMLILDPHNADVMYLLGALYFEVNKDDRAIDLLSQSIKIDPEHDGSLNTLGYIYADHEEKLNEALDLINRALKIRPNNGAYLDSLGWVYYKKGMYDKALEVLSKADTLINDPVVREHIGDVYQKMNRNDEAVKYWELSLQLLPDQENLIKKINDVKTIQASR